MMASSLTAMSIKKPTVKPLSRIIFSKVVTLLLGTLLAISLTGCDIDRDAICGIAGINCGDETTGEGAGIDLPTFLDSIFPQ